MRREIIAIFLLLRVFGNFYIPDSNAQKNELNTLHNLIQKSRYDSAYLMITQNFSEESVLQLDIQTQPRINLYKGIIYRNLGKVDSALYYYAKAENLAKQFHDTVILEFTYLSLANYYFITGDLNLSSRYYKSALDSKNKVTRDRAFLRLGIISNEKKNYHEALNYFHQVTPGEYYKPDFNLHSEIGISYQYLNKYDKALKNFLKAKNIAIANNDSNLMGLIHLQLGHFYNLVDSTEKFLFHSLKANDIFENSSSSNETNFIINLVNIGFAYDALGNDQKQLEFHLKAVEQLSDSPDLNNIFFLPEPEELGIKKAFVLPLKVKMSTLYELYNKNDSLKYLTAAHNTAEYTIKFIETLKQSYWNEESQIELNNELKDILSYSLNIAFDLYQKTPNAEFLNDIFNYSEKSKSTALYKTLNEEEIINTLNIFDENQKTTLLEHRSRINEIKFLIQSADENSITKDHLASLKQELFERTLTFDKLIEKARGLTIAPQTIALHEVQKKLETNETLIEFSFSDSSLFICLVQKENFKVFKRTVPRDSLINDIAGLIRCLQKQNFSYENVDHYFEFTKYSHRLYNTLFEPFEDYLTNQTLTIIPDDYLLKIPFEALISSIPDNPGYSYNRLPYLVKEYNFRYLYSATIFFDSHFSRNNNKTEKIISFAPTYQINSIAQNYRFKNTVQLPPLPYALEEVKRINEIFAEKSGNQIDTLIFTGARATEANFKKHFESGDIVHLAMHTILNDSSPMLSKLVFSTDNPTIEKDNSNSLFAYELINFKTRNPLVVLSACNTGSGLIQKGEGVLGISRGFMYAGCNRMILTLWNVDDWSGKELMTSFYENILDRQTVSSSLREAKLTYLRNADPLRSHPFYWAPYISIGNPEPLFKSAPQTRTIITLTLLTVVTVILIIVGLKRRRKKSIH